jgi:hypothetical protein
MRNSSRVTAGLLAVVAVFLAFGSGNGAIPN